VAVSVEPLNRRGFRLAARFATPATVPIVIFYLSGNRGRKVRGGDDEMRLHFCLPLPGGVRR